MGDPPVRGTRLIKGILFMKTLYIVKSLLPPYKRHKYLRDGEQYDYLGQILIQLGYDIPDNGLRFPSELQQTIPPFTFPCRGSIHDTILTTQILQLDKTDVSNHPQKLGALLLPHHILLEWKS